MNTESTEIDVLGLGAVAVDELLYVDGYPASESKVRVRRRQRQCGGQTGTALVAAARFGARAAYGGLLGEEDLSREVAANFEREGIDTRWAPVSADARPAYSTIVVDETASTRTVFASVEGMLGADPRRPAESLIASARVLLIDHHGIEGNLRAAGIAREAGRSVVADFERDPGGPFGELLGLVDHLIISQRFAAELTGLNNPREAAAALAIGARRLVGVTSGSEGCYYACGTGAVQHQAAMAGEVVDTTGCGDVFHGVYAAALADGVELDQCIRLATAAAGLKAAERGGQKGIPDRETVERFLARFD